MHCILGGRRPSTTHQDRKSSRNNPSSCVGAPAFRRRWRAARLSFIIGSSSRLFSPLRAEVAELADAQASGACGRKVVEVQILSSAPILNGGDPCTPPSSLRSARSSLLAPLRSRSVILVKPIHRCTRFARLLSKVRPAAVNPRVSLFMVDPCSASTGDIGFLARLRRNDTGAAHA